MVNVCDVELLGNEAEYLKECLEDKWLSSNGSFVSKFENSFSDYIGVKHSITCNSGTSGLYTAIKALNLCDNDEIIIPDFTIIVSASVIIQNNLKPVLVDVEEGSCCIDVSLIEEKITSRTKAIMVVHMYGQPCNMEAINIIAKKYKLFVIEDCCQSLGAKYINKPTGNFSDIAVFSFYANKLITTGQGGMIITNSTEIAEKIRLIINNGFDTPRFKHNVLGQNFLLSNIQAAIGLAQLEKIDIAIERKKKIKINYDNLLTNFSDFFIFPNNYIDSESICWMYNLRIKENNKVSKDYIISTMLKQGIECRSYYYGMHEQPVFQNKKYQKSIEISDNFQISTTLSRTGFYIPTGLGLTLEKQEFIIECLKNCIAL